MSATTRPRLGQPLFHKKYGLLYQAAAREPLTQSMVLAYDVIWNLLYYPKDMTTEEILSNAESVIEFIGTSLERAMGAQIFTQLKEDTGQLSFEFENEITNGDKPQTKEK